MALPSAKPRRDADVPAERALPWAVVGAGAHGLAALKALRQLGIPAVGYERTSDVGGHWNFGSPGARVYESTHTITTPPFSQFPDFPMPARYPDYPSHRQIQEYLHNYASHFGLYDHIRFGYDVTRIEPSGELVDVTVADQVTGESSTSRFGGVVVANGHNWHPKHPYYPGLPLFRGEWIHAAQYRSADQVRGKRVLVVGGGNTGCDIAVEAGGVAEATYHSTRRGYWYGPKYLLGRPTDQLADLLLALRVPLPVRRAVLTSLIRLFTGDPARLGLQRPDHALFETHPVINQLLPYAVGHGQVVPKPEIERFDDVGAVFVDGSSVELDLVVFATGYLATFPFADDELLNIRDGQPRLARQMFTPEHPAVVVAGLIQPDAGHWALAHWQAMLIAHYARARRLRPRDAERFTVEVMDDIDRRYSAGVRYADSTRHWYEVAHQEYLAALQLDIRSLEGSR